MLVPVQETIRSIGTLDENQKSWLVGSWLLFELQQFVCNYQIYLM